MNQSEVELMKAENAELKLTLANFTKNYKKFEDLTNNLIRQNSGELLKLINELHSRQEQKLNALKTSNDEVNRNVEATVRAMKSDIKNETAAIYDKIQKDTANSLKKYNEGIYTLEKKSRRFWAIEGIKEALFWCMCLAILVIIGRATFDVYGVEFPNLMWQILYPGSFTPLIVYFIRDLLKKNE
jgi:hypothetical protein